MKKTMSKDKMSKVKMPNFQKLSLVTHIIIAVVAVILGYLIVRFFMKSYEGFASGAASASSTTTVNFYSMVGCGYCVKFQPEWDNLNTTYPSGTALKDGSVLSLNDPPFK